MDKEKLIINMYKNGIGYDKIAKIVNVSVLEVNRVLDRNSIKRTDSKFGERDKKICDGYLRGERIVEIARKLSINRHTVTAVLKRAGIYHTLKSIGFKKEKAERNAKIIELYKLGLSLSQTAEKTGVCPSTVSKVVRAAGEKLRPQHMKGHALGIKKNRGHRKHIFEESFFHIIDTEPKAYWLGFLYADGYVNYNGLVVLCLQERDLEHIEKFRDAIKAHDTQIKFSAVTKSYSLTVRSIEMTTDLANNGCFQRKSLLLKFPSEDQVPQNLIHHFMRGYFDGDGCISLSRYSPSFSVLGTPEFLDGYEKIIKDVLGENTMHKRMHRNEWNEKTEAIARTGNCKVEDIRNFLYKDATVYLDRKKEKFDKVQHRRPRAKS